MQSSRCQLTKGVKNIAGFFWASENLACFTHTQTQNPILLNSEVLRQNNPSFVTQPRPNIILRNSNIVGLPTLCQMITLLQPPFLYPDFFVACRITFAIQFRGKLFWPLPPLSASQFPNWLQQQNFLYFSFSKIFFWLVNTLFFRIYLFWTS